MRRIGVLVPYAENDPEAKARFAAFLQGLQQSGWTDGRNVRIDARWTAGNADDTRKQAAELAALCAGRHSDPWRLDRGAAAAGDPHRADRVRGGRDPVGAGFVDSLARPGGNATGFISFEYGLGGKWLELLKQIAPGVTRAAVLRDPATSPGPAVRRDPGGGAVARGAR